MYCEKCGAELLEGQECPYCKNAVRKLTPEENKSFDGVTIDQEAGKTGFEANDAQRGRTSNRYVYINMGFRNSGFLTKLLIGAFLAGLIVFIALPVAMVALAGVVLWLIFRSVR